jgi:hypothetical protein
VAGTGYLYTILAEYRGGTYVSQIEAETPAAAVQRWSETKPSGRADVPPGARLEVEKHLSAGDAPIPVAGQKNVWCITGTHRNQLILINVVLTARNAKPM